jgi:NitT/TauT family transport system substrate-binding protein
MLQVRSLLIITFLAVLIPAADLTAQTVPTIYVGLVSISPANAPMLATVDGGYFRKYGLDVKPLVMSGSSTAIAALLSGNVSFITIAGSGVINAHLSGSDAIMIAGTMNFPPYELVVSRDIKKIEDLKGKRIGIARFGGSADFLARWALEENGLKPGKDVVILQTGGNPERLAAVTQGAIDGTLLEQAFAYQARKQGLKTLIDYSKTGLDYQHQGIGTTKSYVTKNRDLTIRFLKAMIEGIHRMKSDRPFALKVIERHLRTSDPETLQIAYEYNVQPTPSVPFTTLKGLKFLLDTIAESNPKARNVKPEDIGDISLLHDIEQSGFVKQIEAAH